MRVIGVLFGLLLTMGIAQSQWYGTINGGVADTSDFCDQYNKVTCDRGEDFTYKFSIGREINDYLKSEVFFTELGDARVEDHVSPPDSATVAVSAIGVSVFGVLPVTDDWEVYLKGGAVRTYVGEHRLERVGFMFSSGGSGYHYGVGTQYELNDSYSIRLEAEEYQIDNKTELEIRTVTAGLVVNF